MKDEVTTQDHIISLVWVYFALFPTGTLFNISIPVILLLLWDKSNVRREVIPMIVFVVITAFLNCTESYMVFKPYVRLITIAVVFLTFASVKGNRILFPYILFATVFTLLSQISFLYNVPFLTSFYDRFYNITNSEGWGIATGALNIDSVYSGNTRLGGIYYNPNNCASYMSVFLAMGLVELQRISVKKIWTYSFFILIFISFVVTGSRTSMIVFAAIIVYYLYTQGRDIKKYIPLAIVALIIMSIGSEIGDLRLFSIKDGMSSSLGVKMRYFRIYLSQMNNPMQILFGAGDQEVTIVHYNSPLAGTDCDLGDIFITFGFFFYIAYIAFYFSLYKTLTPVHRMILIVLLWSFSNSLLESFRMCPVWFLSLGICYKQSIEQYSTGGYIQQDNYTV